MRELLRREPPALARRDGADARRCEMNLEIFEPVLGEDRDAIAPLDASRREHGGEPGASLRDLRVRQPARTVIERDA
jgi:hypothetical protein